MSVLKRLNFQGCNQLRPVCLFTVPEFKVEGGCKVKEIRSANDEYREIKVVMDDENKIFEIRRSKRGGRLRF